MASRGILYSAIGEKFTNEAFASAASSRRFNKVPHIIFPDIDCQPPLDGATIEPHQSTGNPYADKIMAMSKSPFDETIFLDTDTFVCREITDLFDLLSRFDMAVAHAPAHRETPTPGSRPPSSISTPGSSLIAEAPRCCSFSRHGERPIGTGPSRRRSLALAWIMVLPISLPSGIVFERAR